MWSSVMFVTGRVVLHRAFQISSALAFRSHEILDALSVFIVASALPQRRAVPVLMAPSCSALGIMLQDLSELFTREEIAPGSSHVP